MWNLWIPQSRPWFPLPRIGKAYPEDGILRIDELEFRIWHTPAIRREASACIATACCSAAIPSLAAAADVWTWPGGSAAEMRRSLSMLAKLPLPGETKVMPGHEYFSTLGKSAGKIQYLLGEWY